MTVDFEQYYQHAKENRWMRYFATFCRVALAAGFFISGYVKVAGERFTALPSNHPLGQYFDALHATGYYYTFLGVVQLLTALLLLIPRTSLLGAIMCFPIIINICILAYAVRFEGTRITTVMLIANVFLLVWNYDRLKSIFLILKQPSSKIPKVNNKFPFAFFGFVIVVIASVVIINQYLYDIRPGNSALECTNGCAGNKNPQACQAFCDCIYNKGRTLDSCLATYEAAAKRLK